ncbi:DUF7285 family protein [Halomicrobium salinisoli]|uniref:DUF7285 family protein n=1 Tax=Halomicrobium salinisoli TaxID=2878391 RepID=UPI001CF0B892|nr:hypothetical protein [Halomicrobium salinisoli]
MSRSSGRGQTEPLAAIVAVAAVGIGLSLYAGVLDATLPGERDRSTAPAALERVDRDVAPGGVARPERIPGSHNVGPDGYRTNVTLTAGGRRWSTGPTVPPDADVAGERIGVRVAPATVRPGRLRVAVWR